MKPSNKPSLINGGKEINLKKDIEGSDQLGHVWFMLKLKHLTNKTILDFGGGSEAGYGRILARHGFNMICVDISAPKLPEQLPNLRYIQGDFLDIFPESPVGIAMDSSNREKWAGILPFGVDIIVNLSSIEHAGLVGRYESRDDLEQDLKIMKIMRHYIKPDGFQLLHIPIGIDDTIEHYHRIYGEKRLPKLLKGWEVEDEAYWRKNDDNLYIQTDKKTCLKEKATYSIPHYYAVGCFKLKVGG